MHDDIITLENVDDVQHATKIILSALVLCFDGKVAIGKMHSAGVWVDMKNGILAKHIASCFKSKSEIHAWMVRKLTCICSFYVTITKCIKNG